MILTVVAAAPPSKEVETAVGIAHTDADTPKAPAVLSRNDADADGTVGGTAESSESTLVAAVLPVVSDCPSRNDVETAVVVATAAVIPAVNAVMGGANSATTVMAIAGKIDSPNSINSSQYTVRFKSVNMLSPKEWNSNSINKTSLLPTDQIQYFTLYRSCVLGWNKIMAVGKHKKIEISEEELDVLQHNKCLWVCGKEPFGQIVSTGPPVSTSNIGYAVKQTGNTAINEEWAQCSVLGCTKPFWEPCSNKNCIGSNR